MSSFSRQVLVVFTAFWKNMMVNIKPWLQFVKWYLEAIMNGRGNYQEKVMTNCRAPFSQRSLNLNWPIRAQSGTYSSRFQTAVDVEHGSRMFVLPHGRILFKLSTTKNGLVITLGVLYNGEFIWLYWNMIFMVIRCSLSWWESVLWSWFAENNCASGANRRPSTLF